MASSSVLAKMAVLISAQTAEFNKAMQTSSNQMKGFASVADNVSKTLGAFGVGFGIFELANGIKNAVGIMIDFEKTMSEVRAITSATAEEFKALQKSAMDLGASTKFTAREVGQLQIEFGRLGFSTKEILAATEATLDLAVATGSDLAKSADVAGSTVRGFGLHASEAQRVVDVMAESFNKSALGIENFSEAMKYVAPVAAQAGLSVEETTAMLGTLADAGIRGSQAGTSLRKIISDLGTESGDTATRIQKLADKGLDGAAAMDEVGRTAYASLLVLAKNTDKTNELTSALNNAAGAGKKAADIMGDNLAGDIDELSSAWEGLILSANESSSILREVTQDLTGLLNALTGTNGALGGFIDGWLRLATIVPRTILGAVKGMRLLFGSLGEQEATLREQEAKTKLIGDHVKYAFANGRDYVFDYIAALKGTKYEQESIQAILEKYYQEQETGAAETVKALDGEKKKREEVKTGLDLLKESLQRANAEYDKQNDPSKQRILATEITSLEEQIKRLERIRELRSYEPATMTSIDTSELFKTESDPFKSVSESMARLQEQSTITTATVKTEWLDLSSSIGGAVVTIADGLGQAVAGVGNFGDTIVKALAGFARQVGETLIGIGVGMLAAKVALKNPYTAIAAGVALVALSSALTSGLQKSQANLGGGGGGSVGASATASAERNSPTRDGERIDFQAEFILKGDQLVAAAKRSESKSGRTFGG